jgi:hypothetical protein
MRGVIPPLPKYVFMEWCSVKPRDNFTFTLTCYKFYVEEFGGFRPI